MKDQKQQGEQLKIRVPLLAHGWLKQQAAQQERSMNWLINKILIREMEAQHGKQA